MFIQLSEDLEKLDDAYENYIREHVINVGKAYTWLIEKGIIDNSYWPTINTHDTTKYCVAEFEPYRERFYGEHKDSQEVLDNFNKAWLHHIHNNPHHWQYWVIINDNGDGKHTVLDMDYCSIIEMICDQWSFSWKSGDLYEIFDWYNQHKDTIIFSDKTRQIYEDILDKIKKELDLVKQ